MTNGLSKENLIKELRMPDHERVLKALAQLREQGSLEDGSLQGVDLDRAQLQQADFSEGDLRGVALIGADLQGATFKKTNLQKSGLRGANLQGAMLHKANLQRASLVDTNLEDTRLDEANLTWAVLNQAVLRRANLHTADLTSAKLVDADLTGADLSWAILRKADFADANLTGTLMMHADFSDAEHLSDKQLARAYGLWGATMPGGHRYDGRYQLTADVAACQRQGINPTDWQAASAFYEVPAEVYREGQWWAEQHLSDLRDQGEYGEEIFVLWGGDSSQ